MGRRAFLIGGAGVAAIGATGGVALFAPFAPMRGRKWLTETEAAAALALAQTLFTQGPTPEEADVLGRLDEAVGDLHPDTRSLFKTGLRALEYASLRFQVGMAYFESDEARAACGWALGCTPSRPEN
jgi:hypothetical protein